LPKENRLPACDDQEASVVQPADGEWEGGRHLSLDLAQSIDIDRHDLRFASVGDPEAVIVPSQRLAELQSVEQDRWIRH
jgi:hypothetical protein